MSDELDLLTGVMAELLGEPEAAQLRALATNIHQPTNDLITWQNQVAAYRRFVNDHVKRAIPAPLRALPGMGVLIDRVVNGSLDQPEQALSLGPVDIGISMHTVYLPRPSALPPGPPELLGLLPPMGASLVFGSGPASGGGTLDYQNRPNQRLSGIFGLKLTLAQVAALVILEESGDTFSLFSLLSARFAPGLQLGFGFALSGVGGLIGINRSVDPGPLQQHFRSGALTHALFGDDPIRDATSVLATLGSIFRSRSGTQVFGPTLQISWLKIGLLDLFNVDAGVFMQLPGPSRIDILASARAAIPPVFRLQLDIHGEIDLANELIGFHAVIVDSHIMGIFRVTGEAIFRWHFGRDPYVLLTIGGFFPGYNPAPAQLPPNIQHVGLTLDLPVSLPIYLRAEVYLAITANSFQFGGLIEVGIDAGAFGASGHIQIDALLQFSPFFFEADFSAGFRVELLGETLYGVQGRGQISGPGPVVIRAEIVAEMPFFLPDISWQDTFVIGSAAPRIEARIHSLLDILQPEMETRHNLRAENGSDPAVALRSLPAGDKPRLSPLGSLVWSQRRIPLEMRLERVTNIPLDTPQSATVTTKGNWQMDVPPKERFNLAQFHELSESQKLNLTGCVEEQNAGVRLYQEMSFAGENFHTPEFDEYYKPDRGDPDSGLFQLLSQLSLVKATARTAPAAIANLEPRVTLANESWQVGGTGFDTQSAAQAQARGLRRTAFLVGEEIEAGDI